MKRIGSWSLKLAILWQPGRRPGPVARAKFGKRGLALKRQETEGRTHQAGLARAVRADQPDQTARRQRQADILDNRMAVASDGDAQACA